VAKTKLWPAVGASLSSAQSTTFVAGATAGYFAGREILHDLMRSPTEYSQVLAGFPGAPEILATLTPIAAGMAAAAFGSSVINTIGAHAESIESISERRMHDKDFTYRLPPWPVSAGAISLVLGENHGGDPNKISYVENPSWFTIPEAGLYGNIIAFGAIGSAKTQGSIYPLTKQLLELNVEDSKRKCGMLALDIKGDFAKHIEKLAREVGRNDIRLISIDQGAKINPLHAPASSPAAIADEQMQLRDNIKKGKDEDAEWITDGARLLLEHCIGIHRLVFDYVTYVDIDNLVSNIIGEKVIGPNGKIVDPALDYLEEHYLNPYFDKTTSEDEDRHFEYHYNYFKYKWSNTVDKSRGYYAEIVNQICLNFIRPAFSEYFCPPQTELNFEGFEQLIDEGAIVLLQASKEQRVTNLFGVMLKLAFQRAALSRVPRSANYEVKVNALKEALSKTVSPQEKARLQTQLGELKPVNTERPLVLLIDEYQLFVTDSEQGLSDRQFFEVGRQSKCISLLATQHPSSLVARIGQDKADNILGCINTRIIMPMKIEKDKELAANWAGKEWKTVESRSISENAGKSDFNPLTGKVDGSAQGSGSSLTLQKQLMHRVEPTTIGELRIFEAIVIAWDGFVQHPPSRVYMKSNFIPPPYQGAYTDPRKLPAKKLFEYMQERDGV
jgi:hypothetical protein